MLERLKNENKVIGIKQSLKSVEGGSAEIVFIAKDAEEKVVKDLKELCIKNNIEIIYVETMKQLGKACGIEVSAASACILKKETN
ncbi:MAG: ribosomal L7Ae/L30e/S12e/Gadd45 family protein [Clostridia bacterium]